MQLLGGASDVEVLREDDELPELTHTLKCHACHPFPFAQDACPRCRFCKAHGTTRNARAKSLHGAVPNMSGFAISGRPRMHVVQRLGRRRRRPGQ